MDTEMVDLPAQIEEKVSSTVELPAPTAWPIVLAFGLTLVFAGLVTSASVSLLGAILAIAGCVGWFRDVVISLPEPPQVRAKNHVVSLTLHAVNENGRDAFAFNGANVAPVIRAS